VVTKGVVMQKTKFVDQSQMGLILATCTCEIALKRPDSKVIHHPPINGVDIHEIPWPPKEASNGVE